MDYLVITRVKEDSDWLCIGEYRHKKGEIEVWDYWCENSFHENVIANLNYAGNEVFENIHEIIAIVPYSEEISFADFVRV